VIAQPKRRHCARCGLPIIADDFRWEASVSHEATVFGKVHKWTMHLRCEIEELRAGDARAVAAIAEAERSGVA
jgi:ribosomal protein L37E